MIKRVSPRLMAGHRVLVVEDEYLIADDMQRSLEAMGIDVTGPAANVRDALALVDTPGVELAILDVNLGGEYVWPVADALKERGIRFIFTTGYDRSALPERYADVQRCEKPVDLRCLTEGLLD